MEFKEIQKFNQKWLWILVIVSSLIPLSTLGYRLYKQVILGETYGGKPMTNSDLIIGFVIVCVVFFLVIVLFSAVKLTVCIDRFGIEYRFFPFQLNFKKIAWDEIENYEVIKYRPLTDYGGYGVRYGFKGKAYNVRGNMGLQLTLKTGKKILLGTQKPTELNDYLKKLKMTHDSF